MSWINDHCTDGRLGICTERRARGILTLHDSCWPPCRRKMAATKYLVSEVLA